jgi:hypothetical protein
MSLLERAIVGGARGLLPDTDEAADRAADTAPLLARIGQLVCQLLAGEERRLHWLRGGDAGLDWAILARAHATAQNAMGRTYYLMASRVVTEGAERDRYYRMAREYLERATHVHVPAGLPDAYVNLALTYMRPLLDEIRERRAAEDREGLAPAPMRARPREQGFGPDWVRRVESLLTQALRIDPRRSKAEHLLGRLYASDVMRDRERAEQHFRRAGAHASSLYELGRLLAAESGPPGQRVARLWHQALAALRRSFALQQARERDGRVDYLRRLVREHRPDPGDGGELERRGAIELLELLEAR